MRADNLTNPPLLFAYVRMMTGVALALRDGTFLFCSISDSAATSYFPSDPLATVALFLRIA